MLASWAALLVRRRRYVLAAAVLFAVVGAGFGGGVFPKLVNGGFDDPHSESVRADRAIAATFGPQSADVVAIWTNPRGSATDPAFQADVRRAAARLRARPEIAAVTDFPDTTDRRLLSRDGRSTLLSIELRAREDSRQRSAYNVMKPLLSPAGMSSAVGGPVAVAAAIDDRTKVDIGRGEMVALPLVLVLLVLIFGGAVAATLPVALGVLAVLGALTVTRLITAVSDVSTFAINSITLLGLGMAIDYSLLVISRFREELSSGLPTAEAVQAAVTTAGRTVLVSAGTVVLSLASLLVFPQLFLHSMAWGGMAAVAVAGLAALTVLPALLAVLGPRINAARLPMRRRETNGDRWAALADSVMAKPVRYLTAALGLLVLLSLPVLHLRLGPVDERVLPPGNAARATATDLRTAFADTNTTPVQVLVTATDPARLPVAYQAISAIDPITSTQQVATHGDQALVLAHFRGGINDGPAKTVVHDLRALRVAGVSIQVSGQTAHAVDQLHALHQRLPWMLGVIALVTFGLLTAAFRAPVLAIKAVIVNVLSIGASFGVLVWGFQDGHLSSTLDFTATGYLEPTVLILVLAILFGLATDYEVFLLGRIREHWLASGDNTRAVAAGMRSTGRIITAAAALLIVVAAGFASGDVLIAKLIGFGMIVAIGLDATLVRALLVPATMRLLGRCNWWSPWGSTSAFPVVPGQAHVAALSAADCLGSDA